MSVDKRKVRRYAQLNQEAKEIKAKLAELKAEILDTMEMGESEDVGFAKVSAFESKRSSWNSEYLEKVLSAGQMRSAKKINTSVCLKVTPK